MKSYFRTLFVLFGQGADISVSFSISFKVADSSEFSFATLSIPWRSSISIHSTEFSLLFPRFSTSFYRTAETLSWNFQPFEFLKIMETPIAASGLVFIWYACHSCINLPWRFSINSVQKRFLINFILQIVFQSFGQWFDLFLKDDSSFKAAEFLLI